VIRHPRSRSSRGSCARHRSTSMRLPRRSRLALANGHIGVRGNLDEGEPFGVRAPISRLLRAAPMPYAESATASREQPDGRQRHERKIMRLLVEDEALDVRYGVLRNHERVLDLRAGVLERKLEWETPSVGSFGSPRRGWFRSPSERSQRSSTRLKRSRSRPRSSCSPSSSPTSRCPSRRTATRGSPRRYARRSNRSSSPSTTRVGAGSHDTCEPAHRRRGWIT